MNEQIRSHIQQRPGGGGLGSLFDEPEDTNQSVRVASGTHEEWLPVDGRTVGDVRRRFRDRFHIDPQSQAMLDGQPADENAVVRAGQYLMFLHHAGEKGGAFHS